MRDGGWSMRWSGVSSGDAGLRAPGSVICRCEKLSVDEI